MGGRGEVKTRDIRMEGVDEGKIMSGSEMWSALKYELERQGERYNAQSGGFPRKRRGSISYTPVCPCSWLVFLLNDIC